MIEMNGDLRHDIFESFHYYFQSALSAGISIDELKEGINKQIERLEQEESDDKERCDK